MDAGDYAVSETGGPDGYSFDGFTGDCDTGGLVTLANGDDVTCTLTNNDDAAKLTVIKTVVNDNGGDAVAGDWDIHVKTGDPAADVIGSPAAGSETGTTYTLDAGDYAVSETGGPDGYSFDGFTGDCDTDGLVTLANGDDVTCTVTNNDQPAKLIVKKVVINDDGGTKTAADFSFQVNGGSATAFEADGQNDLTVKPATTRSPSPPQPATPPPTTTATTSPSPTARPRPARSPTTTTRKLRVS